MCSSDLIVFPGERVLDYIRQKSLALAGAAKRRTLQDVAQSLSYSDGVGVRYERVTHGGNSRCPVSHQLLPRYFTTLPGCLQP